jgi:hypothetical protein
MVEYNSIESYYEGRLFIDKKMVLEYRMSRYKSEDELNE